MSESNANKSLLRRMVDKVRGSPLERGNREALKGRIAQAARIWHDAAVAGDPHCQYALANALTRGQGVLRSVRTAFRWYQAAAEAGVAAAQCQLAGMYANGVGDATEEAPEEAATSGTNTDKSRHSFFLSRDDSKARNWARLAAAQGHVEAQVLLGWLLNRDGGPDAPRQPEEAALWYGRAVEAGNAQAMVGLAGLFSEGHVPDKGPADAYRLYEQAAAQDNATALYLVGAHLLQGIGVPANPVAARKCLLRAADAGIVAATKTLGLVYLHGIGTAVDISQAETWIRRAAIKGDTDSMAVLAELHATGQASVPNKAESILWYTAAAENGHVGAALALAQAHLAGDHVPVDPGRAVRYLDQAANQLPEAAFRLAVCYLDGVGAAQDDEKAAQWMLKAAGQKHPDALYNFGVLLYHGRGVPQDVEAARRCYEAAAELGSASAQFRLAHAHTLGAEYAHDPDRAITLFTAAADQGHCAAQVNLARMLLKHRPADRAALNKVRGQLRLWLDQDVPTVLSVLAELAWRLDKDEATAQQLLARSEALGDSHVAYVRSLMEAGV